MQAPEGYAASRRHRLRRKDEFDNVIELMTFGAGDWNVRRRNRGMTKERVT